MIVILTISDQQFSLNGVNYAKIYQPLKQGVSAIGIYNSNDTRQQLVSSTSFDEFLINGETYQTQVETIAAILDVVFSNDVSNLILAVENKADKGGYSGTLKDLKDEVDSKAFEGLSSEQTLADLLALDPVPPNKTPSKVVNDPVRSNNGNYTVVSGSWVKDSGFVLNEIDEANSTDAISGQSVVKFLSSKADLIKGKNLFDKSDITEEAFLSEDNIQTGSGAYDITGFIEVVEGLEYIANANCRFSTYFDENKNHVAGGSSSTFSSSFVIPSGVKFIRLTIWANTEDSFQVEQAAVSTSYEDFSLYIPEEQLKFLEGRYRANTLDEKISYEELVFIERSKNLFDKSDFQDSFFVSWNDGNVYASPTYLASGFIEVIPSTNYYLSGAGVTRSFAVYDANKAFVRGGENTPSFSIASGEKYIRVTATRGTESSIQFEQGSVATGYEKYGFKAKNLLTENEFVSKWLGYETNFLGDSLTVQNEFQPYIISEHGLQAVSFGVSGSAFSGTSVNSFNNDARVNALSGTAKLIITMGGTNDWAQNYILGAEDSSNINEFYGALNTYIEKLLNKYFENEFTQFIFIGTPYGELPAFEPRGWNNAYTNTQGLTTKDYAKAIKNRCLFYGLHYVEPTFGWNTINLTEYMKADGGLLHPNTTGGKRIASVVSGFLKSIEPIQ